MAHIYYRYYRRSDYGFYNMLAAETYGLGKLQGDTLMLTSYPITMELLDFIVVPATVLLSDMSPHGTLSGI